MRIVIGADHIGLPLKNVVRDYLAARGVEVVDFGVNGEEPVDYPDIAHKVARAVADGDFDRGVLVCGTGIGMAIVANKVPGVRAAQCHDPYSAERARGSNDAQIITMGARVIGSELAKKIIDAWLGMEFQGGTSAPKVQRINEIDAMYRKAQ
jgi:ribose 5-phosphate isomerase B